MYSSEEHSHIFNALLSSAPAIVGVKDVFGRYLVVNDQYSRLFGSELSSFIGNTAADLLPQDLVDTIQQDDLEVIMTGKNVVVEQSVMVNNDKRTFLTIKFPIRDADNNVFATGVIATDITERKRIEIALEQANQELEQKVHEISMLKEELYKQTIRDPLTTLFNRRYLDDALEREMRNADKEGAPLSLVLIDLDNFKKSINDKHGHPFGDQVLKNFADLLKSQMAPRQLVGRLGGEEFMLLLPHTNAQQAFELTEKLRHQYENMAHLHEGEAVYNTFSAGIAEYPKDADTLRAFIKVGDDALYATKDAGRNCTIISSNKS
ncbi:MAG: GGDEF domain-containing protein [Kangiellaceae bacterium]|nr:GGDEF domain-containing protein [Kangiellaceae bacterium]